MEGASLSESPSMTVERTLAVLKPDAVDKAEEIVEEIKENGFTILQVTAAMVVSYSTVVCNIDSRVEGLSMFATTVEWGYNIP